MYQAGDFEGGEGNREAVEVVNPGGVLEAETVLTEQGGLERQPLGVGAGNGGDGRRMSWRPGQRDPGRLGTAAAGRRPGG